METIETLLVEDDPPWKEIMLDSLMNYNLNIDWAESAEEARIKINDKHYDLIILDVGEASFGGQSWSKVSGSLYDWIRKEHPQAYDFADWIKEQHPQIYLIGYSSLAEEAEPDHFDAVLDKSGDLEVGKHEMGLAERIVQCLRAKGFEIVKT